MLKLTVTTVEKCSPSGDDLRQNTTVFFGDEKQGVHVDFEHPIGEGPSFPLICSALELLVRTIRQHEWKF